MYDLTVAEGAFNTECEIWSQSKNSIMYKLAKWVYALQQNVPLDRFGRPTSYIDAEVVLSNTIAYKNIEEFLDYPPEGAFIPIDYAQGYGCANGFPIWERLEGETKEYYNLFKAYLMLHEEQLKPVRMIEELEIRTRANSRQIKSLMLIYHWRERAAEFDKFRELSLNKQKETAIRRMENKHHDLADMVMDKIENTLDNMDFETQELKDIIKLTELVVKLQRLSLGQSPDKPGTGEKPASTQSQRDGQYNQFNITVEDKKGVKRIASKEESDQDYEDASEITAILQACGVIPQTDGAKDAEKALPHVNTKPISGDKEEEENEQT